MPKRVLQDISNWLWIKYLKQASYTVASVPASSLSHSNRSHLSGLPSTSCRILPSSLRKADDPILQSCFTAPLTRDRNIICIIYTFNNNDIIDFWSRQVIIPATKSLTFCSSISFEFKLEMFNIED